MIFVTVHECKSYRLGNKAPETLTHESNTVRMKTACKRYKLHRKNDCLSEPLRSSFGERSGCAFTSVGLGPGKRGRGYESIGRHCGPEWQRGSLLAPLHREPGAGWARGATVSRLLQVKSLLPQIMRGALGRCSPSV